MENTFYLSCCCFLFKMLTTMTKFSIFEMSENLAKSSNKLVTACDSCFALKESKIK